MTLKIENFDFCDFGCSKGSSIKFGVDVLGGRRGLGIDIDKRKVESSIKAGYEAIIGDFCNLNLPEKCVDFSLLSHVLEHLPTLNHATAAIRNAIKISDKFVFIQGPYFDADDYLKSLGLKFYWSDWTGHPLHFTTQHMIGILDQLEVKNYEVYGRLKVGKSDVAEIHPFSSPKDQHGYELEKHGQKPIITFSEPIFKEVMGIIWLSDRISNVKNIRQRTQKFLLQKKGVLFPIAV